MAELKDEKQSETTDQEVIFKVLYMDTLWYL